MAQDNDGNTLGGIFALFAVFVGIMVFVAAIVVELIIIGFAIYGFYKLPWLYRRAMIAGAIVGGVVFAVFFDSWATERLTALARVGNEMGMMGSAIMFLAPALAALGAILAVEILDRRRAAQGLPMSDDWLPYSRGHTPPLSPAPSHGFADANGNPLGGETSHDPSFDFDPSRFGGDEDAPASSSRDVAAFTGQEDETTETMWRKAQDPRTPEGERQNTMRALQKRTRPVPRTKKRGS